jgi:hypothetical protein
VTVEIRSYCGSRSAGVTDAHKAHLKAGGHLGLGNNRNGAARNGVVNEIMPICTVSRNADKQAAFFRMPAVTAHTGHGNIQHPACANNFQTVYELFERFHQVRIARFLFI